MKPTKTKPTSSDTQKPLARRVAVRATWETLALPAAQRAVLRAFIAKEHESPGTGGNVLLAGPASGDKARAAQVLARELQRKLYRVDTRAVISKYIGETEKNIGLLLSEAEASDVILLFDEADALFGKRTGVKDAHDRYAHIEIGDLLQRMKAHRGVVLLAATRKADLDDAYTRRLRFIVEFQPQKP